MPSLYGGMEVMGAVVSVALGLGLSLLFFRGVCRGDSCVVVKSPDSAELRRKYYKLDGECYKYKPYPVSCDDDKSQRESDA